MFVEIFKKGTFYLYINDCISIFPGILRRINRLYPANRQCHAELANLTSKVVWDIAWGTTELAGESKQISRAEYVTEDAWSGQGPD